MRRPFLLDDGCEASARGYPRREEAPVERGLLQVEGGGLARLVHGAAHVVAGVADLVGQALVAVGLAPGFLGLLLAFAIGALHVVHEWNLLMSVAVKRLVGSP